MKISTRNNPAVRLISVTTIGALVVVGMFAVLYRLVDVPFDPQPLYKPQPLEFTAIKRPPVVIPPPPIEPIDDRPSTTEVTPIITLVTNVPPENNRPGPPTGTDNIRWNPPTGTGRPGGMAPVGKDQEPIAVVRIPPFYPVRAETRGIEGWVRVRFTISPNGSVQDARVVAAEPEGEFEESALTAIERWRYSPRVVDGVAVERVGVETLIEFHLTQ